MSLSSEDLAVLQTRLTEAEAAYHLLMTGGSARVHADSNGERVEYTAANSAKLARYIQSLKDLIADTQPAGPLRPFIV